MVAYAINVLFAPDELRITEPGGPRTTSSIILSASRRLTLLWWRPEGEHSDLTIMLETRFAGTDWLSDASTPEAVVDERLVFPPVSFPLLAEWVLHSERLLAL